MMHRKLKIKSVLMISKALMLEGFAGLQGNCNFSQFISGLDLKSAKMWNLTV